MTEACFCHLCGTPNKPQFQAIHTALCDHGRCTTKLCPFCPNLSHVLVGEFWEHLMQYHTQYLPSDEFPTVAKLALGCDGEPHQLFDSTLCKDSDEQSYICGFCLKKIHSFALFDLHTAIFHNDRWNYQRLARGFACPLCSLAYSSCITLRQHWLIIHVSSADSMTPKDDVLKLLRIDPVRPGAKRKRNSPRCAKSATKMVKPEQIHIVQIKEEEDTRYEMELSEQVGLRPTSAGSSSSKSSFSDVPGPSQILMVDPSKGSISSFPIGIDASLLMPTDSETLGISCSSEMILSENTLASSEKQVRTIDYSNIRCRNNVPRQTSPAVSPQQKPVMPNLIQMPGRPTQPGNLSVVVRGGNFQVIRAPRIPPPPPLQPRPNVYLVRVRSPCHDGQTILLRAPPPIRSTGSTAIQIPTLQSEIARNRPVAHEILGNYTKGIENNLNEK